MKLYTLRSNASRMKAIGTVKGDLSIIMSYHKDNIVVVFFNQQGAYIRIEKRAILDKSGDKLSRQMKEWAIELELIQKPIQIQKFFLDDYMIGIRDYDSIVEDFLCNPDEFNDDDTFSYQQTVNEWSENGNFVFWWLNDYWCDRDGYIIAT